MTRLRVFGQGVKCTLFFPYSGLFMGGEYVK